MSDAKPIDIFLMPGDYFVGDERYRVRTLLGSCVSITLWHPALRIGAMSHFLLPGHGRRKNDRPADKPGMYGVDAMELMIEGMARHGVPLMQCQGKIFGGGAMFPRSEKVRDIGTQNGDCARSMLQQYGIHVVSESLYGEGHRQLIFTIRNGEVLSRQVPPDSAQERWSNAGRRAKA
ncbi:chemotaxis protein CheD [Duganella callida]|uniref:Probable chemoreceptor glutamine deamidase CheD n=1 Tax=Duganella callida TaxID=2561932 RepID=A0A4Y9SFU4_9BURK|nr:chemotaxis protein CheD [Duganella callida]TFW22547.1 chemotaxis protein CheD [Duganella callida]